MYYLELALLILFAVLTIVGYRKTNRNLMLAGSLCLVLATATPSLVKGYGEGFEEQKTSLTR